MRIALLEDEAPARRQVVRLLAQLRPSWTVDAELETVAEARAYFDRATPDLVLADIRLSDGDALSLFEAQPVRAPVVFITAYDGYVLQALEHLSVDYLLKPVDLQAFERALSKVERLAEHFGAKWAEARALVGPTPRERVLVRHKGGVKALAVRDVAFFRADDKLTLCVTTDGAEYVVDRTLGQLEGELGARFFRLGRGFLAQVSAVVGFRSGGRGRLEVQLRPEPSERVLVSQESAAAFRAWLDR